ncbi:MAG: carboxypeptidase-like regulatory domain-containing protein [Nitrospirota bacterium]|nr:carboxypeptidase-like regulatory domain-containing protein [Nitrospirota bacterium]
MFILLGHMYAARVSGKIVDAETGKPIEGAVIFAEWNISVSVGHSSSSVHKATETLSDKNGNFAIAGPMNCLVDSPNVVIYRKGYEVWINDTLFPSGERREEYGPMLVQGTTIRLDKFNPPYSKLTPDRQSNTNVVSGGKYYKWDGTFPLDLLYTHSHQLGLIETYTWRSGKKIRAAVDWERPLAEAEKKIIISTKIKCKVSDSKNGKPIKGAIIDSTGCRKSHSKPCGTLTDARGEAFITITAPFFVNAPSIEAYKFGYWVWNFDRNYRSIVDAWNKIGNRLELHLDKCTNDQWRYENCYKE